MRTTTDGRRCLDPCRQSLARLGYDVYVGRPTIWGNPYGASGWASKPPGHAAGQPVDLMSALAAYEAYLSGHPDLIERARAMLKGKVLACWCIDDLSGKEPIVCHAQILARVADGRDLPILGSTSRKRSKP